MSGTGGGRGRHLDAICHRDSLGLPAMPMSQIKGTIRETAVRLASRNAAGWTNPKVARLFGMEDGHGPSGCVSFVGDAELEAASRPMMKGAEQRLFARIAATAIGKSGVAMDRTLRFFEFAVPLRLVGSLQWRGPEMPDDDWVTLLDAACAATIAFGKDKNDGYGECLARVEPDATKIHAAKVIKRARRVNLVLTQRRSAIFSRTAASEGAHKTMFAPTGAALLGWAAAKGPYDCFDNKLAVFHSGAVRFGDSVPLADDGTVPFPFPKILFAPKASMEEATQGDRVDVELARIGRPQEEDDPNDTKPTVQFEAIKKPFLLADGRIFSPRCGQRLRTATEHGRARKSQLFGYQHLESIDRPRFLASIECDAEVSDQDWARVIGAFDDQTLWLGRAKGVSYGGEFDCQIFDAPKVSSAIPKGTTGKIRILAISDIALNDAFGAPTCHPEAEMFGLPTNSRFGAVDSAVGVRRYAPWNSYLRSRDVERQVIEAGSVMSFTITDPLRGDLTSEAAVGLWQQAGLGRIWIDPPFLRGDDHPVFAPMTGTKIVFPKRESLVVPKGSDDGSSYSARLQAWCDRRGAVAGGAA